MSTINLLLEAFYRGETTLEEENALKAFFESDEVPDALLGEKECFLSCFSAPQVEVPEGLLERLEALINEKAAEMASEVPDQTLVDGRTEEHLGPVWRSPWIWTTAVATCLMLLFSIGLAEFNRPSVPIWADTYSDPVDAALEADRALQLMSGYLSTGYEQLQRIDQRCVETEQTVTRQLAKWTKQAQQ